MWFFCFSFASFVDWQPFNRIIDNNFGKKITYTSKKVSAMKRVHSTANNKRYINELYVRHFLPSFCALPDYRSKIKMVLARVKRCQIKNHARIFWFTEAEASICLNWQSFSHKQIDFHRISIFQTLLFLCVEILYEYRKYNYSLCFVAFIFGSAIESAKFS